MVVRGRTLRRVAAVVGLAAVALHFAHGELGLGGHALNSFFGNWVYDAVVLGAAVSCLSRAWLVRRERIAWLVLGIGLALDATGEIYYSLAFGESGTPPIPSLADLFYLLYYPAAYVGLGLLVRGRWRHFSASTWLDGGIAATTAAALIAALAFAPIVAAATDGGPAAVLTNLAYPVGDLILLGIVIVVFALEGWRPGRAWLLLGIGLGLGAIADTAYLWASAKGTYVVGGALDSLWLALALATACAAWQPPPRASVPRGDSTRLLLIPGTFAVLALGVLMYGGFHRLSPVALILAGVALLLVIARAAWTLRDNLRLLETSRRDAVTDSLTGLGNRRRMIDALRHLLAEGDRSPPAVLVMLDLDGFKLYNDGFGHLAGDTLLAYLGARLEAAVAGAGRAFRPGGDEFCVVLEADLDHADHYITLATQALAAEGGGFSVRASSGKVAVPDEASTVTAAMRIADDRMYEQKGARRGVGRRQSTDMLFKLMREREADASDRLREVGRLMVLVGESLGMTSEQLEDLRQAAELHDIGTAAIPAAVLSKPGPLTDSEWAFMRRHTLVGERILAAAPAFESVAAIVRSSHERWDGSGYPDRLLGTAIPLGARIVAVCDAFDPMTSDRPYAPAVSPAGALAELRRCAGTQFDPEVVETFAEVWETESHATTKAPDSAAAA